MNWQEILIRGLIMLLSGGTSEMIRKMVRNEIAKELQKKVKQELDEFEEELS
jgi:hypothetical protein